MKFKIMIAMFLILQGCTSTRNFQYFQTTTAGEIAPPASTSSPGSIIYDNAAYSINVGDDLDIKIQDHDDLNGTVKVRPDGKITLSLIGDITAQSMSTSKLETEINQRYQKLAISEHEPSVFGKKTYHISVNDDLEIKFPYHSDMEQTVKVRPDGRISLSLISSVVAEGKSPETLTRELNRRYQRFLKNPNVAVIVKQFSSMRFSQAGKVGIAGLAKAKSTVTVKAYEPLEIFVGGNVLKPGITHYRQTLTAMTAIIEAGGQLSGAEMSNVVLLRKYNNRPLAVKLDLSGEHKPEQQSNDVLLKPYDMIIVPNTKIDQVGDFVEELVRIVPPIQNSSFAFFYGL